MVKPKNARGGGSGHGGGKLPQRTESVISRRKTDGSSSFIDVSSGGGAPRRQKSVQDRHRSTLNKIPVPLRHQHSVEQFALNRTASTTSGSNPPPVHSSEDTVIPPSEDLSLAAISKPGDGPSREQSQIRQCLLSWAILGGLGLLMVIIVVIVITLTPPNKN